MLVDIKPEQLTQFYQDANIGQQEQSHFNQFINSNKRKTIRRNLIMNTDNNYLISYMVSIYLIIITIVLSLLIPLIYHFPGNSLLEYTLYLVHS